jgi:hypothetical protein
VHRRHLLASLASTALAAAQTPSSGHIARKGRIRQSCFTRSLISGPNGPAMSPDEMFQLAAHLGAAGFDMLPAAQWPLLKQYGLIPTMGSGGGVTIQDGIIHKAMHDDMAKSLAAFIYRYLRRRRLPRHPHPRRTAKRPVLCRGRQQRGGVPEPGQRPRGSERRHALRRDHER